MDKVGITGIYVLFEIENKGENVINDIDLNLFFLLQYLLQSMHNFCDANLRCMYCFPDILIQCDLHISKFVLELIWVYITRKTRIYRSYLN